MTMPAPDSERIATSSALFTLAERFMIEATMWREPSCKAELERGARLLSELARGVANHASELAVGDAYLKAGDEILAQIQGARRFFIAIVTIPSVARNHVEP